MVVVVYSGLMSRNLYIVIVFSVFSFVVFFQILEF